MGVKAGVRQDTVRRIDHCINCVSSVNNNKWISNRRKETFSPTASHDWFDLP